MSTYHLVSRARDLADPGYSEGHEEVNGRVTEVSSTERPPRMPSDGSCGCRRVVRSDEQVLLLCERHGRESGIVDFCLP